VRFATATLPDRPDVVAPDGSDVRVLLRLAGGSMAHFTLPPGTTSRAVRHRTVEEIWYVVAGTGEMWRHDPDDDPGTGLQPRFADEPGGTVTTAPGTADEPHSTVTPEPGTADEPHSTVTPAPGTADEPHTGGQPGTGTGTGTGTGVVVPLEPGTCLTIPVGTSFQFRCTGATDLAVVAVTMPPWPDDPGEAVPVDGAWPPTASGSP
jgi:mannose-6-phosphate isomerase-like protein (cupin superfamily)